MPGAGGGRGTHTVDAQLLRELGQLLVVHDVFSLPFFAFLLLFPLPFLPFLGFSGAPGIRASSGESVSRGTDQDRTRPNWTPWRGSTASRSQSAATRIRLPGIAARW